MSKTHVLAICLVAVVGLVCNTGNASKENASEAPCTVVSPNELVSAYDANEIAADSKYKGKKLCIEGVVSTIEKSSYGVPMVTLENSHSYISVTLTFTSSTGLESLQKGQRIKVSGIGDGLFMANVVIKNTKFVTDSNAEAVQASTSNDAGGFGGTTRNAVQTQNSLPSTGPSIIDSSDLELVSTFSLLGYSSEGAGVLLYKNTKTTDSIVAVTYYGEMGKGEYKFKFNKKLLDAEKTMYWYTGHIMDTQGEIGSIEKSTLKTSKEASDDITERFLEIREELTRRALIRLGFEYLDKGDNERTPSYYDSAIEEFNRVLQLGNEEVNSDEAYLGRGRAYLRKGDNKRAIADFSAAINLNQQNEIALSNRGRAYARIGDYDNAVADFEAATKIAPNNNLIKQNLERARRHEKGL